MYVMSPVNLVRSVPPNVSSPFLLLFLIVGSKEMETRSNGMIRRLKRLFVIVGMLLVVSGDRVPMVRSVGPILHNTL